MTDQALALPPKPLLRGWSHVVGFVIALSIGGVLIAAAPAGSARVSIVIYVFGLCTMLGVSSLYHRVTLGREGPRVHASPGPLDDLPGDRGHLHPHRRHLPRRLGAHGGPRRRVGWHR